MNKSNITVLHFRKVSFHRLPVIGNSSPQTREAVMIEVYSDKFIEEIRESSSALGKLF